ncbi:MAG: hypothetical protein ACKJSK_14090 [Roseibacillus sp.]
MALSWSEVGQWRRAITQGVRAGVALLVVIAISSCASQGSNSDVAKASMDLALDTAGQRMFYKGTAAIPRSFNSTTSFEMDVHLAHWGNPARNEASAHAQTALGKDYKKGGIYQPLTNGEGLISLASGRVLLHGKVLDDGQELDGNWFIDGKLGGGFRIARKGYIFP